MNDLIWLMAAVDADIPKVSLGDLITNVLNIIYFLVGIAAVVVIILSGYSYITSDGNPDKAKKGMRGIVYSAIGIAIVVFAFARMFNALLRRHMLGFFVNLRYTHGIFTAFLFL